MEETITISTGSRLHFGLYAFGEGLPRQFGGVGAMVDVPIRVRVARLETGVAGVKVDRNSMSQHGIAAQKFVDAWFDHQRRSGLSSGRLELRDQIQVTVLQAPDHHVGLGLGTQLGLSISLGLFRAVENREPSLIECATAVGRGLRSAVGTYGFFYGGLIVDQGKLPGEGVSPLQCRLAIPDSWRWVLMQMPLPPGLSGPNEKAAFERLSPMSAAQTQSLRSQITQRLLPALEAKNFEEFSDSLYAYGRAAGECFAEIQGGPYRSQLLAELVEQVRTFGVTGVGQSSWGPTLFALTRNEDEAETLTQQLKTSRFGKQGLACEIVRSLNQGVMGLEGPEETKEETCRNSVSISTT